MIDIRQREAWLVTGSQELYGKETLEKVAEHSKEIASGLGSPGTMPVKVVFKPVVTTPGESSTCAGRPTRRRTASG